jgi:hypothetical protein
VNPASRLDRADQARELVDAEGMVTNEDGANMGHAHPALRVKKDARAHFMRGWSKFNLNWRE